MERIIMTRCRVSEEDARDPYFDGTEPDIDVGEVRDRFGALMLEVTLMTEKLFRDKNFEPDEDDLSALEHLHSELKYYEKVKKL
jgi:hypothetical protein